MQSAILPIFVFIVCVVGLGLTLLVAANLFNPIRPGSVKRMPYESGMDPIHDTRRRFSVRFYLLAIAFLVFDVELLFLYPWAVAMRPAARENIAIFQQATQERNLSPAPLQGIDAAVADRLVENRDLVFAGVMLFIAMLTLGFVYDWRRGVFRWR